MGKRQLSLHPQSSDKKKKKKKKSCNLDPRPLRPGGLRSSAPRSAGNGPAPLCAQARAAPGAHGHLARAAPASLAGKHGSVDSGWGLPGRHTLSRPAWRAQVSCGPRPRFFPSSCRTGRRLGRWLCSTRAGHSLWGLRDAGRASPPALLSASRVAGRSETRPCKDMQSIKSFH